MAEQLTRTAEEPYAFVKTQMQEHPLVTVFFSLFALAVMALWLRKYFKVAQSGFINLSEKGGMDGLLGNTAGGKVD